MCKLKEKKEKEKEAEKWRRCLHCDMLYNTYWGHRCKSNNSGAGGCSTWYSDSAGY